MKKWCIYTCIFLMTLCSGCQSDTRLEHEGSWYCAELGIFLSFDLELYDMEAFELGGCDYPVYYLDQENSERIRCGRDHKPQYDEFKIICSETAHPKYENGYVFFEGKIVSVENNSFTVKEHATDSEYIFLRTDKTEYIPPLYSEKQLSEILSFDGSMSEITSQYETTQVQKIKNANTSIETEAVYQVTYTGELSKVIIQYDSQGNKISASKV